MNWGPIETLGPIVLLFGSLFGAFAFSAVKTTRRNNAQPERTIRVQVVAKPVTFGTNRAHVIKFQAEDGEVLDISVTDDAAYSQMTKGMYGMLTFRGWNYKSFVPTEPPVTSPFPPAE